MAMKINPPGFNKSRSYERYEQELLGWRVVTEIPKAKQLIAIALSSIMNLILERKFLMN